MAERDTRRVAHDLMDEPHIAGRRISVRQVYALVEERGVDPEAIADRYDLDGADVYHALAYYHDHPREMSDVEAERDEAREGFRESIERPEGVESVRPEMAKWRFLLDENIDPTVATYLDKEDLIAEHVRDALGQGTDDEDDILPYTREHDLIVVTSDVKDFGDLPGEARTGVIFLYDDTMPAYRVAHTG